MVKVPSMRPLQPHMYSLDLKGCHVVEASAGTGKTYSIQTLYLRLVLEYGLTVDSVVVVTFTEKATRELRDRLRGILRKSLWYLDGKLPPDDGDYSRIEQVMHLNPRDALPLIGTTENQRRRLQNAIRNFDQAAVCTIHSFCARILQECAFETGVSFDLEMLGGADDILQDVVNDWFRCLTARSEFECVILRECGLDRKFFMQVAKCCIEKPDACIDYTRPAEKNNDLTEAANLLQAHFDRDAVTACLRDAKQLSHSEKNYRDDTVAAALNVIEHFLQHRVEPTIGKAVYFFTSESLCKALNKNQTEIPEHPFFADCDRLWRMMTVFVQQVKEDFILTVKQRYEQRRDELHVHTYSDLIFGVRDALRNPRVGPCLKQRLDTMYTAALIDEFQDTDPAQYEIFKILFLESELRKPVFLVGDPKQAIYSFRSGDVYTYYDAVAGKSCYQLECNYRSEKELVEAVNRLFGDNDERRGFITDSISYDGQLRAQGRNMAESLRCDGEVDAKPLKIFFTPEDGSSLRKGGLIDAIAQATAAEVQQLLSSPQLHLRNRLVKPSDIAILVTRHEQARILYPYLQRLNIPVVMQSTGNIFDAAEAAEMQLVLAALIDPIDRAVVRSALATDFFSCSGAALMQFMLFDSSANVEGEDPLDDYVVLFMQGHDLWRDRSFIEGFNFILERTCLREYVLGLQGGERKLTNILHLSELLHEAAQERKLGLNGLQQWLAKQRDAQTRDRRDEFEIRLESDSDAVQIMTVFASKGLEFPIVLVPFMWDASARRQNDNVYQYHVQTPQGHRLHVDLDCCAENQTSCGRERLAELVRLLYVGLTRAANRAYLTWGNINQSDATAPNWVLHGGVKSNADQRLQEVNEWCRHGGLEMLSLPVYDPAKRYQDEGKAGKDPCLELRQWPRERVIDKSWHIASFTTLHPNHTEDPLRTELHDLDADDNDSALKTLAPAPGIFDFPAGKQTGNCWHMIFEKIDFTATATTIEAEVRQQLQQFHMLQELDAEHAAIRQQQVCEMVQRVLSVPLPHEAGLRLCDVPLGDRLTELEFHFPLPEQQKSTAALWRCLQDHWGHDPSKEMFLKVMQNWNRTLPRGILTGKIDLVFRTPQTVACYRYFLADWKSNKLDGLSQSFGQDGLTAEMARHAYFLQYLFYTVALHQFLKLNLGDAYSYDSNFGAVFYLFLRGVDGVSERGIFYDRPTTALIEDLSKLLGDFQHDH